MFCTNCGKEINENDRFCCFCGTRLQDILEGNREVESRAERNGIECVIKTIAFWVIIVGNFLCLISNFIPIYTEQELGAEYTYTMWELINSSGYSYNGNEMVELVFMVITIPLIGGTISSLIFFVMLALGMREKRIVTISGVSMLFEIVYVAFAYVSLGYIDSKMMGFQEFANSGIILFAIAFMNLIFFHGEYTKESSVQRRKFE